MGPWSLNLQRSHLVAHAIAVALCSCGGPASSWSSSDRDASLLFPPPPVTSPGTIGPPPVGDVYDHGPPADATIQCDAPSPEASIDDAESADADAEGWHVDAFAGDADVVELCQGPSCPSNWWMFGYAAAHTGYNTAERGAPPMVGRWDTSISQTLALNPACAENGRAFVTCDPSGAPARLTAIDITDGTVVWTFDFGAPWSVGHPSVVDGNVFVQTNKGTGNTNTTSELWAIDAASGHLRWRAPFDSQWENYWSPTVGGVGVYVNGGRYGGLYGFRRFDGAQLFYNSGFPQCDLWTPAFYNEVVYSYVQGSFVASDPASGALLWNNAIRGNFTMPYSMNATAALDGTHAYLVSPPQLAALNLHTQDFDWVVSTSFTGTPAVAEGVVYAISGGAMIASDAATGTQLFMFASNVALTYPPIVANGIVYVSASGNVFGVSTSTHAQVWTASVGGWLSIASGTLLVAGGDGTLHGFALTGGSGAPGGDH